MLSELHVENLVIIAAARLAPGAGMTAITGETGAGKSLLLDAIALATGARGSAELVGPSGEACSVTAVIEPSPALAVQVTAACGVPAADGAFLLRRRLSKGGRSQAWINDVPVTLAALRAAAALLVAVHAQHEPLRLADPAVQRGLIDAYGGHGELAERYAQAIAQCSAARRALAALDQVGRDGVREIDYLRFQEREFAGVDPKPGELASLEERHRLLSAAGTWRSLAAECEAALGEGDRALYRQLARFARKLAEAPGAEFAAAAAACQTAADAARDAAIACQQGLERIDEDPQALASVGERLDAWNDLLRKHGPGEAELFAAWTAIRERLALLSGLDGERARLTEAWTTATAAARELGTELAAARSKAAAKLARTAKPLLADLGLPAVEIALASEPLAEPEAQGTANQFLTVRTNPGFPLAPLNEVLSGGEAARIALAIAAVAAAADRTPVLIFDEIDSGVGGRLATALGALLARLGNARSVLCVTHSPQVAAAASRHYAVRKQQASGTTRTDVVELDAPARRTELADMLGGGAPALAQAKALLASVGSHA